MSLFFQGIGKQINLSLGTTNIIVLFAIAVILLFIDKKRVGIGTFMNAFLVGFLIDVICKFFSNYNVDNAALRVILMLVGIILTAMGIGIYISAKLGESGIDAIMMLSATYFKKEVKYVRMVIDAILITLGTIMDGSLGISTFVSMFLYGVVIDKTLCIMDRKTRINSSVITEGLGQSNASGF